MLLLLSIPVLSRGQWSEQSLKKVSGNKSLVDKLNRSYANLIKNSDTARYYANLALKEASKQNDLPAICLAYAFLSHVEFQTTNYYKALEALDMAASINSRLHISELEAYINYVAATKYSLLNKIDLAIEQSIKALSIYEQLKDSTGAASLYKFIGILYSQSTDPKSLSKAGIYFQKALKIHILTQDETRIGSDYSLVGQIMKDLKKYDSASYYIHKGIQFNKKFNNTRWLATDYLRLGELMSSLKQYDSAEYYLDKSSAEFSKLNHIGSTIYVINQKGQIARDRKQYEIAQQLYTKAYQLSVKYQMPEQKLDAIEGLYETAADLNNFKTAFTLLKEYTTLNDSVAKSKNLSVLSLIEIQREYEFRKRNMQLENEQISIKSKRKSLYIAFLISTSLLIIIIFIIVLYFHRIRQRALQLEKQKLNMDLEYKNKELITNIMSLMKKNETMAVVSQKLGELENEDENSNLKSRLKRISKEVQDNVGKEIWEEFDLRFKEVHTEFYKNLLETYPELTAGELRLCALLRLNLSTKEIAQLTGQNIKALEMARFRLRKKLGIVDPDTNLVVFLSSL